MRNSDLKRLLKTAYAVEPTARGRAFTDKYRTREMNYGDLLLLQCRYLGPQLTAIGGYALAVLLGTVTGVNADFARFFAALMPAAALFALTGLGKSSRYGMAEMEAASRFSLRMVKILRLAVIGVAGVLVMLAVSCALKIAAGTDLLGSFALTGFSYLTTTFLCMLLIRKWHSEKNIYGCAAIVLGLCLLMFRGIGLLALYPAGSVGWVLPLLLLLSLIPTAGEACKYIKGSEEIQWN